MASGHRKLISSGGRVAAAVSLGFLLAGVAGLLACEKKLNPVASFAQPPNGMAGFALGSPYKEAFEKSRERVEPTAGADQYSCGPMACIFSLRKLPKGYAVPELGVYMSRLTISAPPGPGEIRAVEGVFQNAADCQAILQALARSFGNGKHSIEEIPALVEGATGGTLETYKWDVNGVSIHLLMPDGTDHPGAITISVPEPLKNYSLREFFREIEEQGEPPVNAYAKGWSGLVSEDPESAGDTVAVFSEYAPRRTASTRRYLDKLTQSRLEPDELAWVAADQGDRFVVLWYLKVDDQSVFRQLRPNQKVTLDGKVVGLIRRRGSDGVPYRQLLVEMEKLK